MIVISVFVIGSLFVATTSFAIIRGGNKTKME